MKLDLDGEFAFQYEDLLLTKYGDMEQYRGAREMDPDLLKEVKADVELYLEQAKGRHADGPARRQKLFWEVFVDQGKISGYLREAGAQVEEFGLANGWDFRKPWIRREFAAKLERGEPDEVFLVPPCEVWSQMQHTNVAINGKAYAADLATPAASALLPGAGAAGLRCAVARWPARAH